MNLITVPHKLSFLQLFQWASRPSVFLDDCTKRYGDFFTVAFPGSKPFTLVSHPQALEHILTAPPGTFVSGEGSEKFRPIMGNYSLMVLDGKPHQRLRKLMMPSFHGERMRLYGNLICELTEQMMKSWKLENSFNLHTSMQEISLNTLLNVVFGVAEGENTEQLHQKLLKLVGFATSPLLALHLFVPSLRKNLGAWSPWGRFLRLQKEVDQLLYAEIAQRHQHPQPDRTDILTLLMSARDEEGEPMSDQELRDELLTLLLGGYDTTSTAITWALYWIHRQPDVRERLLEELNAIDDPSDTKAIAKLPYLSATCQEALRLTPSIVLGSVRIAQMPLEIMGQELPQGTWIYPNIYSAHRRADVYPEPDQFKPERFLEQQFSPYEYFPFGGGTRGCIGTTFAQFQMKLVLFTILSRYQLALIDSRPVQPIRRGPGLVPSKAVHMMVTACHLHRATVPALV
ncbi:cytochrome P450 [Oculatella sp. LEGE 06141]|uniref:cytochrome P450 n=1 Tax=Oculatella sp. LEGE 06141 TaxID=1828648 RepID=UPI0018805826|nr:cytochrome P450 [Oculatella sp. LEGE 06141]MBE9181922.1 cytochrome P450 [Oculatella sp. LEGE 06141]